MENQGKKFLLRCLARMLEPVLRFCHSRAIKAYDVFEVIKEVYIDIAAKEIEESKQKVSIRRLSVTTGIDRRDVKRIYKQEQQPRKSPGVLGRVIASWQDDSKYTTEAGSPRVLTAEGDSSEFCQLVRSVDMTFNPYTVLYELERVGCVKRTPNGVKLSQNIYVARGDTREAIEMMARDTRDLMSAVEENIQLDPTDLPNYHLATECDNIPLEMVPKIKQLLLEQGSIFHEKLRQKLARYDRDYHPELNKYPGTARVVFGGYSRIEMLEKASS